MHLPPHRNRQPVFLRSAFRLTLFVLLPLVLAGPLACYAPMSPQSGRIAPMGTQRIDASWQLLAQSAVATRIDTEEGVREVRVNAPGDVPSGRSFAVFSLFAVEVRPMIGLGYGTEAGLVLSAERLGLAGRFGLRQRSRGDRVDLALGLETAWSPFFSPGGPDVQLRLDASRRIRLWEPLVNVGVRYGPTSHAALVGTQSEIFASSNRLRSVVVRTPSQDLRLSMAIGTQVYLRRVERVTRTSIEFGDRPLVFHAALVPWARLASMEGDATCSGCIGDFGATTERTAWGLHFVAGFNLRPGRYFF